MATRKKKPATRRRSSAKAPGVAAALPKMTAERIEAARRKFEDGLVARGEAVPEGKPLPPGATHTLAGHDAAGRPILKRKRFSVR